MGTRLYQALIAASAVAAATVLGTGVSAFADSGSGTPQRAGLLTQGEVDKVWSARYNTMLGQFPPGTRAVVRAPDFFHPQEPGTHLFEASLVDRLMVQALRCSWIEDGVAAAKVGDAQRVRRAEAVLSTPSHLQARDAQGVTFGEYLSTGAKAVGTDVRSFERATECSAIEGGSR